MNDWRAHWFDFADAVYLNTSAEGLMPRVAIQAAQRAVDAKTFPHRVSQTSFFDVPNRLRASIANLIGGRPEEVALTTGASAGTAILAYGLPWKPGDEVITSTGEFPLQYTTWAPLAERERRDAPRGLTHPGRFLSADDLIAALSPRTRLVSVSLVRFDDGSMLDASKLARACHAQGVWLALDISQCCGAVPIDVAELDADFMTCGRLQVAAQSLRHGFLLVQAEPPRDAAPGAVLLDGHRRRGRLQLVEFRGPQALTNRQPLGRARVGRRVQPEPGRDDGGRCLRRERWSGHGESPQRPADRSAVCAPAARPRRGRESRRRRQPRSFRLLQSAHTGGDEAAVRVARPRACRREPSRGQHPRLAVPVQYRTRTSIG